MIATLSQIALKIIKEQAFIIGPLAWIEASKVLGIKVLSTSDEQIEMTTDDQKEVINRLVAQYERLFGKASHEVCKEAVHDLLTGLSQEEIPSSLK